MKAKVVLMSLSAAVFGWITAAAQIPPPAVVPYPPYGPGRSAFAYPYLPSRSGSDYDLRNRLRSALFGDSLLNAFGIRYQVSGGVVTLTGQVDNGEDAARAVWHAYNVGAQAVSSQLRIGPWRGGIN